jgi:hypothetical protein
MGRGLLAKIYSMILESAFGIYDVSGWNANVTLELGIAFDSTAAHCAKSLEFWPAEHGSNTNRPSQPS